MPSIAIVLETRGDDSSAAVLKKSLASCGLVCGFAATAPSPDSSIAGASHALRADSLRSREGTAEVLRWFDTTDADYLLWIMSPRVELTENGLGRLVQTATDTRAAWLYSDFFDLQSDGTTSLHSLIDYQPGSLRDDFEFGDVVLWSRAAVSGLADVIESDRIADKYGGAYDLRLRVSERGSVVHLCEPTYAVSAVARSTTGEAHFDYVDPRHRDYQVEMERIATEHLRRIEAWLPPPHTPVVAESTDFSVACSVVIPVRNRVRTIADAVRSALAQRAEFPFNVIVVDNHSTDGTTPLVSGIAAQEPQLVHLVPDRHDLGIGGCWNEAIYSPCCGRYAVQLDSDDLYADSDVLSRVMAEFHRGKFAAVIGSYTIVDFDLQPIPPGLIDHREWTPENGHNNALRIAGLGAPRAFHVPTLRTIGFPNVSFGEDYAVMLRLSRQYPLGRIYDSLYWCRRWEGNTDHALPLETRNRYAFYKDRLRSIEIAARQSCGKNLAGS